MRRIDTLIVGGSQAGLAMSRALTDRGVEHLVLERGRIGERWRSERWDSLRLLTPNWQSRLPGFHYRGSDPHGFMTRLELVAFLEEYAASFAAPVESDVEVLSLALGDGGFRLATTRDDWAARNVVVATGQNARAAIPAFAAALSPSIVQIAPTRYRAPGDLPPGGVLVVGASSTGVQLAHELQLSGRPVTIAVGRHTRLPRRYRGRDILAWLDATGILDERADQVRDLARARRQPSFQLAGRSDGRSLDLGTLAQLGVRLVGRVAGVDGARVELATDLAAWMTRADDRLADLLDRIDRFVERAGLAREVGPPESIAPLEPPPAPAALDLDADGIRSVVWATGYRRDDGWLPSSLLDERGELRHEGGVTAAAGLFGLGLRFQLRRNSSFLDGVGADAEQLADRIAAGARNVAA